MVVVVVVRVVVIVVVGEILVVVTTPFFVDIVIMFAFVFVLGGFVVNGLSLFDLTPSYSRTNQRNAPSLVKHNAKDKQTIK